jgi:hypothetical protein
MALAGLGAYVRAHITAVLFALGRAARAVAVIFEALCAIAPLAAVPPKRGATQHTRGEFNIAAPRGRRRRHHHGMRPCDAKCQQGRKPHACDAGVAKAAGSTAVERGETDFVSGMPILGPSRRVLHFHPRNGLREVTAPKRQYPTTTNKGGTLETHTTRVRAGTAKGRLLQRSWVGVNRSTRWALDNAPALRP